MSIYEYDQEKHLRQEREEHWKDGHESGLREGHKSGLVEGKMITTIEMSQEFGLSVNETVTRLMDKYSLKYEEAQSYIKKYWK